MTRVRSPQELVDLYVNEAQAQKPELTDFTEGSINDHLAQVTAFATSEAVKLIIDQFRKTYFRSAVGSLESGAEDELEVLATDHFGSAFARPGPQKAVGVVTFSRPDTSAGDIVIPVGTVVRTTTNANGTSTQFATISEVTITTTTINASVRAVEAGTAGNVAANKVTVIQSTLGDPSLSVDNSSAFSGGAAQETDPEYRQTIRNLIEQLPGATIRAVEAKAKTVSGVEMATILEKFENVREVDPTTGSPLSAAEIFRIPRATLYIADANGTASQALVDLVKDDIESVRAAGVLIKVAGAEALSLNWTASITLNPGGPNFSTLNTDSTAIIDSMKDYLNGLAIGKDFVRSTAEAAILAIWGPAGSDDLTAFSTTTPVGDVNAADNEKLVPGTVSLS